MSVTIEQEMGNDPPISPELLAILVCPVEKSDLRVEGTRLVCVTCGRTYPIEDGIPNMFVEDAS